MKDVTSILNNYRECIRHLWNSYFLHEGEVPPLYTDDLLDQFEEVERVLFSALVLTRINKISSEERFGKEPLPFLVIAPAAERVPIMINRFSSDGNRYWDEPVKEIGRSEARLHFIECFDWNSYGHLDLKYYKVRISLFPTHSIYEGRDALIEVQHVRILFDEDL